MDDQTNEPAAPAEGQTCGCTCEFCMAGNHETCQSGMCNMKTQPAQETKPEDEPN